MTAQIKTTKLPHQGESSFGQFRVDWRRENDANYTARRKDFLPESGYVPVKWDSDGPYLLVERQAIVRGSHTLGYVGGGSSFGGTTYKRLPMPEYFVLAVSTTAYDFQLAKIPAGLSSVESALAMTINKPCFGGCWRHAHTSTEHWDVLTPDEIGKEVPCHLKPDFGPRAYQRVILFCMSLEELMQFISALPCTDTEGCKKFLL